MTDDITYKTVPLNIASSPARVPETAQERAARVQAHMDRVHPVLDAIEREEARVYRETGDPAERARFNTRKSQRKQRALAKLRATKIAAMRSVQ